jgi:peptidoglycan/LPS O-acetylase OafA/YrhL
MPYLASAAGTPAITPARRPAFLLSPLGHGCPRPRQIGSWIFLKKSRPQVAVIERPGWVERAGRLPRRTAAAYGSGKLARMPHNEFIAQLRGVAVITVVSMHYVYCFPISYSSLSFVGNGYYGVAMFFTISGFLITTNMFRRYGSVASVSLRDFYVKRAARILPPLAMVTAILSAISLLTNANGFVFQLNLTVGEAIAYLLTLRFNQYYVLGASLTPAWAVLWSISVEEAFYFVYPLTAIALRFEKLLVAVLCTVILVGPYIRWNGLLNGSYGPQAGWDANLFAYLGCFDLMDMGALAAIAAHRWPDKIPGSTIPYLKAAGAALSLSAYLFLNVRTHPALGPSMIGLGAALMLYAASCRGEASVRPRTWLGRIGSLSYEIYLFHLMIGLLLMQILPRLDGLGSYGVFVAVMAVTYFTSAGIARTFSRPSNRWIRARFSAAARDGQPRKGVAWPPPEQVGLSYDVRGQLPVGAAE